MSPQLIAEVDRLAQAREESRAAFVRRACEHFMAELQERELEAAYERGYLEQPEELEFAETVAQLAAETWPNEDWSDVAVSKHNQREDR
jgi:metal-responsive CopG/Arc/MetJ family transcriptional regulator